MTPSGRPPKPLWRRLVTRGAVFVIMCLIAAAAFSQELHGDWYELTRAQDGTVAFADLGNVQEFKQLRHIRIRVLTATQYTAMRQSTQGLTQDEVDAKVDATLDAAGPDQGIVIDCQHALYIEDGTPTVEPIKDGTTGEQLLHAVCPAPEQSGTI